MLPSPADPHSEDSADSEIVCTRVLNLPRHRVFEAFSNADQLIQWWGPKGFTNNFHHFDFRAGGVWRFSMQGPDGANYDMEKHFSEITPPERIIVEHRQAMHNFRLTMTFEDTAGRTTLTWRMRFEDPAETKKLRGVISAANEENFDRLQAFLGEAVAAPVRT